MLEEVGSPSTSTMRPRTVGDVLPSRVRCHPWSGVGLYVPGVWEDFRECGFVPTPAHPEFPRKGGLKFVDEDGKRFINTNSL